MESIAQIKQETLHHLAQSLNSTFERLRSILPKDSKKLEELVLVEAWYREINQKILLGTISPSEATLQINQIRKSVLDIVSNYQESDLEKNYPSRKQFKQRLKKGKVLYHIPRKMLLHREERCLVRVAIDEDILLEDLDPGKSEIRGTRIAKVMSAALVDPNDSQPFTIRPISDEVQFFEEDDYTEWVFYISPNLPGTFLLALKIAVITIIDGKERKKDIVLEEKILITAQDIEQEKTGFEQLEEAGFLFFFQGSNAGTGDSSPVGAPPAIGGNKWFGKGAILAGLKYLLWISLPILAIFIIALNLRGTEDQKIASFPIIENTPEIPPSSPIQEIEPEPPAFVPTNVIPLEDTVYITRIQRDTITLTLKEEPEPKPITLMGTVFTQLYSQNDEVIGSGKLIYQHLPLVNVQISYLKTKRTVQSDSDGNFTVTMPPPLALGDSVKVTFTEPDHQAVTEIFALDDHNAYHLNAYLQRTSYPIDGNFTWQCYSHKFKAIGLVGGIYELPTRGTSIESKRKMFAEVLPKESFEKGDTRQSNYSIITSRYPIPTDSTKSEFELIKKKNICPNIGEKITIRFDRTSRIAQSEIFPLEYLQTPPQTITILRRNPWRDSVDIKPLRNNNIRLKVYGKREYSKTERMLFNESVKTDNEGQIHIAFVKKNAAQFIDNEWIFIKKDRRIRDSGKNPEQKHIQIEIEKDSPPENLLVIPTIHSLSDLRIYIRRWYSIKDIELNLSEDFCECELDKNTIILNQEFFE